jgi:hypothetical protein
MGLDKKERVEIATGIGNPDHIDFIVKRIII